MEVCELPPGEQAPDGSNRVTINVLPNGKSGFAGVYQGGNVEHHQIHSNEFTTEADALKAALQWAEERNIGLLYVERPNA